MIYNKQEFEYSCNLDCPTCKLKLGLVTKQIKFSSTNYKICIRMDGHTASPSEVFPVMTSWNFSFVRCEYCRSQRPCGLRRGLGPSNTMIVGSNPTRGMNICVSCVVLCRGHASVWSHVQGILSNVNRVHNIRGNSELEQAIRLNP
jgi:hypothetical protein